MEIVLYDSRTIISQPISTEVPIIPAMAGTTVVAASLPLSSTKAGFLRYLGAGFLTLAVASTIYVALPAIMPKIQSLIVPRTEVSAPAQATFEQIAKKQEIDNRKLASEEAAKYGVTTDFSIVIPKISATAKVVPNVNPADEEEYRNALKLGVAHALGSKLPGNQGTIFLFAHSTNSLANVSRYNAVFYQLKDLEAGDKIVIFYTGQRFVYQVTDRQTIEANDVKWLADESEEKLVLQTCWPPGTSLKRLIIIARPV